jgi:N-acyl amino acid synthase FeeM
MKQMATTDSTQLDAAEEQLSAGLVYGPACSVADLRQSFSLAYIKYRERGLAEEASGQIFFSKQHLQQRAVTLVGKIDHTVFTTLSVVMDGPMGLPLDAVFADELNQFRRQGAVLGELGLFADRRRSLSQSLAAMHELFRLGHWYVEANNFDFGVIGVHPRHAAFYQRLLGFRLTGEVREHPTVRNAPAVLLIFEQSEMSRIAERCKYVRQWLQNPVHVSVWEQRYRPGIADLVALTSLRSQPEMLDELLPFYRTTEQLAQEKAVAEEKAEQQIRKAG